MTSNMEGNRMRKTEDGKGSKGKRNAIMLAVILVVLLILGLILGTVQYVGARNEEAGGKTGSSEQVPGNPRQSATEWLTKLMGRTSERFGTDMFSGGNAEFKKLMQGDTSFIPKDIREGVRMGTSSDDDMMVPRHMLDGSAYAGLIMYSTAYKNTKDGGKSVPGYSMTSYDGHAKTVYIPARAIMLTEQPITFAVTWDGGHWVLQGDSIAWDVYAMLEDSVNMKDGEKTSGR